MPDRRVLAPAAPYAGGWAAPRGMLGVGWVDETTSKQQSSDLTEYLTG